MSGKPQLDISLYLTPDQRFLVPELNDSTVNPNVEEERRRLAARKELEKDDGRPALGPADAPVTIVVFSDFQCPYCRKFAETMKQVVSEEKRVRFLFRNMPLDMHAWAKPAANLAACVQMQNREAFWSVHDYLFDHQQELDPESLPSKMREFLRSLRNIRADKAIECANRGTPAPRIAEDVALASKNKVQGTPTVFVNGRRVNGGSLTREHILTLVQEALSERPSAATEFARPKRGF